MNKQLFFALLAVIFLCSANVYAPDTCIPMADRTRMALDADSSAFGRDSVFTLALDSIQPQQYSLPLRGARLQHMQDGSMQAFSNRDYNVRAVFSGTVQLVNSFNGRNLTIVISHDNGLQSVCRELMAPVVHAGEHVAAGQVIAHATSTGKRQFATSVAFYVGKNPVRSSRVFSEQTDSLLPEKLFCWLHHDMFIATTANYVGYVKAVERAQKFMVTNLSPMVRHAAASSINLFDLSPLNWSYPLVNSYVTSPYDKLRERDDSTTYHHTGIDIKTHICHDSIHSAFDGVVEFAAQKAGYGNCVVIKHAFGMETLYGHLSTFMIKQGERVRAGEVIGLTGATGHATGDHLHFELLYHGQRQDPGLIFNHKKHCLQPSRLLLGGSQLKSVAVKYGSLYPLFVAYKNHKWRNA